MASDWLGKKPFDQQQLTVACPNLGLRGKGAPEHAPRVSREYAAAANKMQNSQEYTHLSQACFRLQCAKLPQVEVPNREIQIWRAQDKLRQKASAYVKEHLLGIQINEREELNERKRLHRLVRKRVNAELQGFLAETEERRERLRDLLEKEEMGYIAEMESLEETTENRKNKMLAKAKLLRENREDERQKLVAEKREQQFRVTCEELRTQWSKKHLLEVCEDRLAQLALKEELKKQRDQEEATFLALWEEDRLAKEKRAAEDERKRSTRNDDMLNMLRTQRAAAEAQRKEEQRLKDEEAKYMEEERLLRKLEDERAEIERRRKLRACGDMLQASMREKMTRLNQTRQEELALETKVLEHILGQGQEDLEEQKRRKGCGCGCAHSRARMPSRLQRRGYVGLTSPGTPPPRLPCAFHSRRGWSPSGGRRGARSARLRASKAPAAAAAAAAGAASPAGGRPHLRREEADCSSPLPSTGAGRRAEAAPPPGARSSAGQRSGAEGRARRGR
ncbi:cilia- and flagella-associated protein 53 [Sphaerodactylus townsendi]|uniref:cilia- and flagella-associated protein 53 n=1 Tax=Sphaerodactylus townsendi TaxID=933632 RepID=UPI0020268A21|nr:cilia- and flagella-associated protein 53 [Sphaerodactylus townsendi]